MKLNKKAFAIALLYVGLGSIAVMSIFPNDIFYSEYSFLLILVTFPTNILSLMVRYSCADCFIYIGFVQIAFLGIWYMILKSIFN